MATSDRNHSNEVSGRKATENLENDENTTAPKNEDQQKRDPQGKQDRLRNEQPDVRKERDARDNSAMNKDDCNCENDKKDPADEEIDTDYFDPVK